MQQTSQPTLVVAAVIQRSFDPEKRVLIVRRGPQQSGAGHWEFPGGKVEAGESPQQALIREINEELALSIRVGNLIGEQDFAYPHKKIRLRGYWAEVDTDLLQLVEHDAHRWCLIEEIDIELLSAADRPFVALMLQGRR